MLEFAERILAEEAGDPRVVIAAALLHDIGIRRAETMQGSSAPRYQELEGPPIARRILWGMDFGGDDADHVCRIAANHHSGGLDTPEFRIIWDADWLVNLPDVYADASAPEVRRAIRRIFKTETGAALARETLLDEPSETD